MKQPDKSNIRRSRVTGFPSPADESVEQRLDINDLLVHHAAATFFMRCTESDDELELRRNDILVIDRSLTPSRGNLVVAICDGELLIERFDGATSEIWGVVSSIIRQLVGDQAMAL